MREKWDIPAEHLREADLIRWRDLSRAEAALFIFSPLSVFPDAAPSHYGRSESLSAEITAAAASIIPSPGGDEVSPWLKAEVKRKDSLVSEASLLLHRGAM